MALAGCCSDVDCSAVAALAVFDGWMLRYRLLLLPRRSGGGA